AFKQYKRSSIETAGKLDLVIMCYDKAILCLQQSKDHIIDKNFINKGEKIKKTLDIINELQANLDLDKGGTIAKSLDSLYTYLTSRIILADVQKNLSIFDECITILGELKSAWEGIKLEKTEPAPVINRADHEIPRLSHQIAV
ncbi:MAG: flagellar export chaperone FliS, partial [Deltaproteobacteria bacterium]|nr:flagellar export chaperone FliS [Deltaproteobacteria bacterium]